MRISANGCGEEWQESENSNLTKLPMSSAKLAASSIDALNPSAPPGPASSTDAWVPTEREPLQSNLFRDSGTLLALMALALLATFLFAVLDSVVPPRLLDPA